MKVLVDEQLSPDIATQLRGMGWDAQAIRNERRDLEGQPDDTVTDVAHHERRVVVTNNIKDFRPIAAERLARGEGHSGLILIPGSRPRTKGSSSQIAHAVHGILEATRGGLENSERWLGR